MNSQREVIYKKRRNAINGERLDVDILNMLYDTCEDIVLTTKDSENYDDFRLNVLTVLGLDFSDYSNEEFYKSDSSTITEKLYQKVIENYEKKNSSIISAAMPIIKKIKKERGAVVKDVLIPFTDGSKQIGVSINFCNNSIFCCISSFTMTPITVIPPTHGTIANGIPANFTFFIISFWF